MAKRKGDIRNRVRQVVRVRGSDLRPNPENWRRHPDVQREALDAILHEVGQAGVLLAYRDPEAPDVLTLIDGHERAEDFAELEWDVAELDVTPDEARKLLLVHDPLGALAEADAEALAHLRDQAEFDAEALRELVGGLGTENATPDFAPVEESTQGQLDQRSPITCPECGHQWTP